MNKEIKTAKNKKEIESVCNYVKQFPVNYPNYDKWLKKAEFELKTGYKKAFYVTDLNNIIASIVFQPHKQDKKVLEIKNIRVSPNKQGKNIGEQLCENTEELAKQNKFQIIQVDTRQTNTQTIEFFLKQGFKIKKITALYSKKDKDVILTKKVEKSENK